MSFMTQLADLVHRSPSPEDFERLGREALPGHLGIHIDAVEPGSARSRLHVTPSHMAPNGYVHAGTVVALADTSCGYGCVASLPPGASGFTTVELKTNFLGSVTDGTTIACAARLVHGGRTTQVWDAEVTDETSGRSLALFRCTQFILYPRPS
jgi:uncharacterized protein (TIGR00369 family)